MRESRSEVGARGVADESEGAKKVGPVNGTWFKAKYYDREHISRASRPGFTLARRRGTGVAATRRDEP